MSAVIEVEALAKQYRRFRRPPVMAVDGLDLSVPEGGVFGFLGPNGSGKTTTIRCLLGLVAPSGGRCRVLHREVPEGLPDVVGRVGSIVEEPKFFPNFSGYRNLRLLAQIGGFGTEAVDTALGRVGLADRAADPVKGYSLGMRQRLGLAAALMKDPALLVLDEPANGLDPAGIREVRDLLRELGAEGRTVFVSSHILAEVEQICDRVAILHRGTLVREGTVAEVLASVEGAGRSRLRVDRKRLSKAAQVLATAGLGVDRVGDELLVETPEGGPARITELLAQEQLWVSELRADERTLEDAFLELTAEPSGLPGPPVSPPPPPPPPPPAPEGGRSA